MAHAIITTFAIISMQGVLRSTAISQCPAGDTTCGADADDSSLLQSQVQIANDMAEHSDGPERTLLSARQDRQEFKANSDEEWPSWKSIKKAAKKAAEKAAKKYEKAKEAVEEHGNNLVKKGSDIVEEAIDQALATTDKALLDAQNAAVKMADQAWFDVQAQAEAAAEAAAAEADKLGHALLGPLSECVNIKKLAMDIFMGAGGKAKSFVEKEKSKVEVTLSKRPKFSASLKTSLGKALSLKEEPSFEEAVSQANGQGMSLSQVMTRSELSSDPEKKIEWGFGPERIPDISATVTAGAKVSFDPLLEVTLEPADGNIALHFEGDVRAIIFAEIKAEKAIQQKYTMSKTFPEKPISMSGCAGPFCLTLMMQGMAQLDVTADIAGLGSAEVKASYQISGDVNIDVKSGDVQVVYETGKLTHSEKIKYESSFKGTVDLHAAPVLTFLPMPGLPVSIEPWVKVNLKAHSQGSGARSDGSLDKAAFLEANASDATVGDIDASGFWQTHVQVAAQTAAEESDVEAQETDKVCGKAGVNVHAGARITSLGPPNGITIDTAKLKEQVLTEVEAMPAASEKAIAAMVAQCPDVKGVAVAADSFNDVVKAAADEMAGFIRDLKLTFDKPEELYKTPKMCTNVWKDTLPKGETCGSYDTGC